MRESVTGTLHLMRGSAQVVELSPYSSSEDVAKLSRDKHLLLDKDLPRTEYVLLYKDCSRALKIPGTDEEFTLKKYKELLGKPYQRLQLYICPKEEFERVNVLYNQSDDSSSESTEIKSGTPTISFKKSKPSTSRTTAPVSTERTHIATETAPISKRTATVSVPFSDCTDDDGPSTSIGATDHYSNYITILSSDSDDYDVSPAASPRQMEDNSRTALKDEDTSETLNDSLSRLAGIIKTNEVSRFNINRRNVWDGACRGFKRTSFSAENTILVKFTDDDGTQEEAVDQGGPRREFLRLLMTSLQNNIILEGKENARVLALNSNAMQRDDYHTAGLMIAVSLVHGGPSPTFFSKSLYNAVVFGPDDCMMSVIRRSRKSLRRYLTQMNDIIILQKMDIDDIHAINDLINRESQIMLLAGCFQHVKSSNDKVRITQDLLNWFVFGRTRSAYERFLKGLETLGVLREVRKNSKLFERCFLHHEKRLTAIEMENIFVPVYNERGSNRRIHEERIIGYWRDYLQDAEEKSADASLEAILIFATGIHEVPPIGLVPTPSLNFIHANEDGHDYVSRFPISNSCANELRLPIHATYDEFKAAMDFGILNSPSFGRV